MVVRKPCIYAFQYVPPVRETKAVRRKQKRSQTVGNPKRKRKALKRSSSSDSESADAEIQGPAPVHHRFLNFSYTIYNFKHWTIYTGLFVLTKETKPLSLALGFL